MKNHLFARNDVLPSWVVNQEQEFISTLVSGLRLRKSGPTTVQVDAAAGNGEVTIGIEGHWRYRTSNVSRAHPGGAAGIYPVFVVASANVEASLPLPFTDLTDYNFDLRIEAPGGTPTIVPGVVDHFRQVGTVEWDGSAITSVVQTAGQDQTLPVRAVSREATEVAGRFRGAVGQTADVFRVENSSGVPSLRAGASQLGFFGVAPASRPAAGAELKAALAALGLLQDGSASPLDLDGGALSAGAGTFSGALSHGGPTLGFFGVPLVARPGATAELKAALISLGLLTAGGATPLDLDGGDLTAGQGTFAAASGGVAAVRARQVGDADYRVLLMGDGTVLFGDGSSSANRDTDLYRRGADNLGTHDDFTVGGALDHDGSAVGFFGRNPTAKNGTAFTNGAGLGTSQYDLPVGWTMDQLAALVMTLIKHLGDVNGVGLINSTGI